MTRPADDDAIEVEPLFPTPEEGQLAAALLQAVAQEGQL